MKTFHVLRGIALILALSAGRQTVQAQESVVEAGDFVVTKADAPLMVGTKKLAIVPVRTKLTVTDVRDSWIAVQYTAEKREFSGWVWSGHVEPASPIDEPLGIVRHDASHFTIDWNGFGLIGPGTTMMRGGPGVELESQPIKKWRLEVAKESGAAPKANRLALRLILPLEDVTTNARLIAQFLSESRFEVILPDGSKQSLAAKIDAQQANPEILFIGDVSEAVNAGVKAPKPSTSFAMLPAQLFHLGHGKHTFRWVHGKNAEELRLDIR